MKNSDRYPAFKIFLVIALLCGSGSARADTQKNAAPDAAMLPFACVILDGKVYAHADNRVWAVPIAGAVLGRYRDGSLWYLRAEAGKKSSGAYRDLIAGIYDFRTGSRTELSWKPENTGTPLRIAGTRGVAYVLTGPLSAQEGTRGALFRMDLNGAGVLRVEGVMDFALAGDAPCILTGGAPGTMISINGRKLPLPLSERAVIVSTADDRILLVSDGDAVAVVDARESRVLAVYAVKRALVRPGDFNFELVCTDESSTGDPSATVFFKVYIDGAESGRTGSGPAGTGRSFRTKLDAGAVHVVRAERWELNRAKEKYERANNINQPGAVRVLVPEGAILRLECVQGDKGPGMRSSLVTE